MGKDPNISISYESKGRPPRLPFVDIKEAVLGKKYELSILFASQKTSKHLNKTLRGKDKSTNVLSFELSKNSGEIILDLEQIKKEIDLYEASYKDLVGWLFIHGLLHLKGMDHGSIMDKQEEKFCKKFGFKIKFDN